jgi:RNAse (barnase) inhibitor barstar
MSDLPTYVFPGEKVTDLESFFQVFGEMVNGPGGYFGKTLSGFDDCLFGRFGLEEPCRIIWQHADISRNALDHACLAAWARSEIETKRYLDEDGLEWLRTTLDESQQGIGPTMFDILVDTINSVGERAGFSKTWKYELVLERCQT